MGALVELPSGTVTVTAEPGVFVESDEGVGHALVRRLTLDANSPLYPSVDSRVTWPKNPPWRAALLPSLYVVEQLPPRGTYSRHLAQRAVRYLEVTAGGAGWVTEAGALIALGAIDALTAIGLDDASVALTMGDLAAARVQWLRWKDGTG